MTKKKEKMKKGDEEKKKKKKGPKVNINHHDNIQSKTSKVPL